ncbi:MAG: hypothetical protein ACR2G5_04235 [Pyrinomonadaceae bacterium]
MKEFAQLASMAVSDIRQTRQRSFHRGLSAVPVRRITPQKPRLLLTTEEAIQVNLATVRESSSPRYWPTDALRALLELK